MHIQYILFEPFAVAVFALDGQICHKLHLYRDSAFAFTFFAASTGRVETEMWGAET